MKRGMAVLAVVILAGATAALAQAPQRGGPPGRGPGPRGPAREMRGEEGRIERLQQEIQTLRRRLAELEALQARRERPEAGPGPERRAAPRPEARRAEPRAERPRRMMEDLLEQLRRRRLGELEAPRARRERPEAGPGLERRAAPSPEARRGKGRGERRAPALAHGRRGPMMGRARFDRGRRAPMMARGRFGPDWRRPMMGPGRFGRGPQAPMMGRGRFAGRPGGPVTGWPSRAPSREQWGLGQWQRGPQARRGFRQEPPGPTDLQRRAEALKALERRLDAIAQRIQERIRELEGRGRGPARGWAPRRR